MYMMINQLYRFCEMITICNNNFRTVVFNRDNHGLAVWQRVDFLAIDNGPYFKKAEKGIILPCYDNIIFC